MGAKANMIVAVLFVLCVSSLAAFDYYQLVLQYQANMCSSKGKTCQRIPKQEFTIHGLWPSNHKGPWLQFCSNTQFDQLLVSKQQAIRLNAYWPDLLNSQSSVGFWTKEWLKHGTCSENLYTQDNYFDYALDAAIDVRKRLASQNIIGSGTDFTATVLEGIISKATGAIPALKCLPKAAPPPGNATVIDQLTEIVICLDPTLPLTYQNCNANLSKCKGKFTF